MGLTAARRAARLGAGLLFDSLSTPERNRELVDAYRAAGGTEPCIAIRRAWVGEPPRSEVDAQIARYRSYSPSSAQARWGRDELVAETDPGAVAEGLIDTVSRAGATAVNLRVHVPGLTPGQVREQIERLGADVIGPLRASLGGERRTTRRAR